MAKQSGRTGGVIVIVAGAAGYSDPRVPQPNLKLMNMILIVEDDAGLPLDSAIQSFTR